MSFSDSRFLEYYESLDAKRTEDLQFYLELAKTAEGPVLDIGCGSGRILLPSLKAGIDIWGFDNSPKILELLEQKDPEAAERVWVGNMEDPVSFGPRKYSLVLAAFNTFTHLLSQEHQLSALGHIRRALVPGGKIALDIINPINFDIFESNRRELHSRETDHAGIETAVWRWFESDPVEQTSTFHREHVLRQATNEDPTKVIDRFRSRIEFRWIYPPEMRLLLTMSGFGEISVFGDFSGAALTEDSSQQVWVATAP